MPYLCYVWKELNIVIQLLAHFSLQQYYLWFSMFQETCLLLIIPVNYQNIVSDVQTNISEFHQTFLLKNSLLEI